MLKRVGPEGSGGARTRRLVLGVFLKVCLLLLGVVVILRVVLPYLIDLHSDLALILAFAVGIAGLAALIWFTFDLFKTIQRIGDQSAGR